MAPTLDRMALEALRERLLNNEQSLNLVNFFVNEMKAELLSEPSSDKFNLFFGEALGALAAENSREISERSKSPIEKIFLNSLVLCAIKSHHLLSVHSTYSDCATEI